MALLALFPDVSNTELMIDVLDDDDDLFLSDSEPANQEDKPWEHLEKAKEANISCERSLKRTSATWAEESSAAKKTRVAGGKSTQVKISPHQRLAEFPYETLVVSSGKLFCEACHSVVNLKKSILKDHIDSEKHKAGTEERLQVDVRQQRLTQSWKTYQKRQQLAGTVRRIEQHVRRIETTTAMMKVGIPLAKLDYLRPHLEHDSDRLTFSTHLSSLYSIHFRK